LMKDQPKSLTKRKRATFVQRAEKICGELKGGGEADWPPISANVEEEAEG